MITSSPLPPRGIFVPSAMLFHSELPSSVLLTWIQLRALAWQGWSTPPLSLAEFASLLGIHPSRLEKHLDHLQSVSALSLHKNGTHKFVISFPGQPTAEPQFPAPDFNHSNPPIPPAQEQERPELASYFPRQILGYITYDRETEATKDLDPPEKIKIEPTEALLRTGRLPAMSTPEVV